MCESTTHFFSFDPSHVENHKNLTNSAVEKHLLKLSFKNLLNSSTTLFLSAVSLASSLSFTHFSIVSSCLVKPLGPAQVFSACVNIESERVHTCQGQWPLGEIR